MVTGTLSGNLNHSLIPGYALFYDEQEEQDLSEEEDRKITRHDNKDGDYDINDELTEEEEQEEDDGDDDEDDHTVRKRGRGASRKRKKENVTNSRKKSLRSASPQKRERIRSTDKKTKRGKGRKPKKAKKQNVPKGRIECFKCLEKSPAKHMVLFVCCDAYYHLSCAGYTTTRTQRAIQQHIDNGTINKQCPECVKKGRSGQSHGGRKSK